MKYPKLWNGASPVGEALVRALQRNNTPYLSSVTADGVTANKMGGRSEVFQGGGAGGFISQPAVVVGGHDVYPAGSSARLLFKSKILGKAALALPIYQALWTEEPKYGGADWQGSRADAVISWSAWSWMGVPTYRYDPQTQLRGDRRFYDVTKSNVFFVHINVFNDYTWGGLAKPFSIPTLRYQCVGNGLVVYRDKRVWRTMLKAEQLSDREYIQGAAISKYDGRAGCFIFLRETDVASGWNDGNVIRAGWLNADGTFDETHRFQVNHAVGKTVQGWYFNRKATKAVCVFEGCRTLEFTHERGFRLLEDWRDRFDPYHPLSNSFQLGRDLFGDELLKLDIEPNPHPHADYVGRTVRKSPDGEYEVVNWRIPQRRWDYASQPTSGPSFTSRAVGSDLRTGTLLVVEQWFDPAELDFDYPVPWVTDDGALSSTNRSILLKADFVVYQHGEEVLRKPIPM